MNRRRGQVVTEKLDDEVNEKSTGERSDVAGTSPGHQRLRLCAPHAGSLGTRSHTLQLRACVPQLKSPWHN